MDALYASIPGMPSVAISVLIVILLFIEILFKRGERACFWVSLLGLAGTAMLSAGSIPLSGVAYNSMITVGGYGAFFSALFSVAAFLTVVLSAPYLVREQAHYGEFYILICFSTLGMMLMASAADLIILFLGLEVMSIGLYVLAGFLRKRAISNESSLKYFLLGAFATCFLLYGIAFLYGASGTTNINAIVSRMPEMESSGFFLVGVGLLMVGLAFKIGAVPFHMWVPDVYQGSPTPVSGFMSTGGKAAAFAAFVLLFIHGQSPNPERVRFAIALIAAASMVLGNIVALAQSNIKRMLAYSSVAHTGYMLTGLAAGNSLGKSGILFYLVAYTFMNIGAFGVVSLLEREEEKNLSFDDYAGLAGRKPFLALVMSVFMISLAGIPPFAGFFGKYYVFLAAINAHMTWLAIIGVLTSVISVYYYLRLVMVMYFREGEPEFAGKFSTASVAALAIAALVILELGLYPSSILSVINSLR
jgi:NADH-quinone oxidoreductase subunit N